MTEGEALEAMRKIIDRAEEEGRDQLTAEEMTEFKELSDRHQELRRENAE